MHTQINLDLVLEALKCLDSCIKFYSKRSSYSQLIEDFLDKGGEEKLGLA